MNTTPAYFLRVDDTHFEPTVHTGGGWDPDEIHFSPLGGLVVHAIERHLADGATSLVLSRLSFDILGRLATDTCEIRVTTVRPGRTIELVEATVLIGGRAVVLARAWLLARGDTSAIAGETAPAIASPDSVPRASLGTDWPGGYIASLEVRPGGSPAPGRATVWLSTEVALIADEPVSDLASFVALVDTANGVAIRENPREWIFPNVDLTVHFYRQPEGGWVGLDTSVAFGPTGQGVTSSVLHDIHGAVGFAQQMLTVRPV
ncbi:MAG: thioesterase family protein [Rhodoglobus sp.]|nr:thioesterase family protein [Rhodoglobus sp.]